MSDISLSLLAFYLSMNLVIVVALFIASLWIRETESVRDSSGRPQEPPKRGKSRQEPAQRPPYNSLEEGGLASPPRPVVADRAVSAFCRLDTPN
jgi:hypothetical protein